MLGGRRKELITRDLLIKLNIFIIITFFQSCFKPSFSKDFKNVNIDNVDIHTCYVVTKRGEMYYAFRRHDIPTIFSYTTAVSESPPYHQVEKMEFKHPFMKVKDKIFTWGKCKVVYEHIDYEYPNSDDYHFIPSFTYIFVAPLSELIKVMDKIEIERDGQRMLIDVAQEYEKEKKITEWREKLDKLNGISEDEKEVKAELIRLKKEAIKKDPENWRIIFRKSADIYIKNHVEKRWSKHKAVLPEEPYPK